MTIFVFFLFFMTATKNFTFDVNCQSQNTLIHFLYVFTYKFLTVSLVTHLLYLILLWDIAHIKIGYVATLKFWGIFWWYKEVSIFRYRLWAVKRCFYMPLINIAWQLLIICEAQGVHRRILDSEVQFEILFLEWSSREVE